MTRDQLEHAIRAACDVAEDTEVYVFGSQAILAQHPDAPAALLVSEEADISPKHRRDLTDLVDALLGQDSMSHRTHGFYVHGVPIHEAATLPPGCWSASWPCPSTKSNGLGFRPGSEPSKRRGS